MKKLFAIASLISSCFLFSCKKETVDINGQKTNGLDIGLSLDDWCKQGVQPGGSPVNTNHQIDSTGISIPALKP